MRFSVYQFAWHRNIFAPLLLSCEARGCLDHVMATNLHVTYRMVCSSAQHWIFPAQVKVLFHEYHQYQFVPHHHAFVYSIYPAITSYLYKYHPTPRRDFSSSIDCSTQMHNAIASCPSSFSTIYFRRSHPLLFAFHHPLLTIKSIIFGFIDNLSHGASSHSSSFHTTIHNVCGISFYIEDVSRNFKRSHASSLAPTNWLTIFTDTAPTAMLKMYSSLQIIGADTCHIHSSHVSKHHTMCHTKSSRSSSRLHSSGVIYHSMICQHQSLGFE